MYAAADLAGFVDRMRQTARRECVLVVRAPSRDGLLADAARIAWGHPHFAPDFTVAYNILLDMGLHPDVAVERFARREADPSPSSAAALEEVKRRLGLDPGGGLHDEALADLLRRRLVERDGRLEWPGTVRSAVIHWSTAPAAEPAGPAPWTAATPGSEPV